MRLPDRLFHLSGRILQGKGSAKDSLGDAVSGGFFSIGDHHAVGDGALIVQGVVHRDVVGECHRLAGAVDRGENIEGDV